MKEYYFYTISLLFCVSGAKYVKDICEDDLINCSDFSPETCTQYPEWASGFCPHYCGLCIRCDVGWTLYQNDNTCYRLFGKDEKTRLAKWSTAVEMCQKTGGSLVQIKDENKNTFVLEMLQNSKDDPGMVWTGLKNYGAKEKGFNFKFVDGSPLEQKGTGFPQWLPSNPDNFQGKEECVIMYVKGLFPGKWNDIECNQKLGYVCSKPAGYKHTAVAQTNKT